MSTSSLSSVRFICPDCKTLLKDLYCAQCDSRFSYQDKIVHLLPRDLNDFKKAESEFHNEVSEQSIENHQLKTLRNLYYHEKIFDLPQVISEDTYTLELGCGSGFDAVLLLRKFPNLHLVVSDISNGALILARRYIEQEVGDSHTVYVQCDAENLPFDDATFDFIFMVATLHHLESTQKSLRDIKRCLHTGGYISIGMEPAVFFSSINKLCKPILKKFVSPAIHKESPADEHITGFSSKYLQRIFQDAGLNIIKKIPVWFFTGFLHYFLEFLYRFLKLKKRISLPVFFERVFIFADLLTFRIPFLRVLCFHWIILAQK